MRRASDKRFGVNVYFFIKVFLLKNFAIPHENALQKIDIANFWRKKLCQLPINMSKDDTYDQNQDGDKTLNIQNTSSILDPLC